MGVKVLILGESGTGKSASMRNFKNDELFLVNVANKTLPFKVKGGKIESINSDNYRAIKKAIQETTKKSIVIDDSQYLMANEFMRRATEKGFDKFTEIGQNYWDLSQAIDKLPEDVVTYVMGHIERDQNGNEKVKTIGKLLDEKITVEGMYTIVLKTVVQDGKYFFQTQNSGHDTCKSPIGMFDSMLIDNDLKAVDKAIRDYYELGVIEQPNVIEKVKRQAPSWEEAVEVEEPKVEEPKRTLAEKLAAFKNNEPSAEMPKRRKREEAPSWSNAQPETEQPKVEEPKVEEQPIRRSRRRA